MITEIEIEGFKSLEKVKLKLGSLNLFVGANASGKSNFFDTLRVLQGIGYGLTVDEIFNGKPKSAISEVWEGIRGGSVWAQFVGRGEQKADPPPVRLSVADCQRDDVHIRYSVSLNPRQGLVISEVLRLGPPALLADLPWRGADLAPLTVGEEVTYLAESATIRRSGLKDQKTFLQTMSESFKLKLEDRQKIGDLTRNLGNMQRIEPDVALLRSYSQPRSARRMGERGENFAALIQSILGDENLRSAYLSWLQQLTPVELDDVTVLKGAVGEPLFALKESGKAVPAQVLSDGTLRFAALTAAFFQPDMPDIITVEEIENGIHPSRLRLLVELLKSQSGGNSPQVFATTHSPVVLAWLDESDYETTFFCKRDEETGASIIKPLSEVPHLIDLIHKDQSLGELFMQGWMEAAL